MKPVKLWSNSAFVIIINASHNACAPIAPSGPICLQAIINGIDATANLLN